MSESLYKKRDAKLTKYFGSNHKYNEDVIAEFKCKINDDCKSHIIKYSIPRLKEWGSRFGFTVRKIPACGATSGSKGNIRVTLTGKEMNTVSDLFYAIFDTLYESYELYYKDTPITLEVVEEL